MRLPIFLAYLLMNVDRTSLYNLPKDLLVELLVRIQHNENNNYRMYKSLVDHRVEHYQCYKEGCIESCMSYDGREKKYLEKEDPEHFKDIEFAFPHLKETYALSSFWGTHNNDTWNTTGALCGPNCVWACAKHWKEVFYSDSYAVDDFICPEDGC